MSSTVFSSHHTLLCFIPPYMIHYCTTTTHYCVFIPPHTMLCFHTTTHFCSFIPPHTMLCFHATTHYCVFIPPHTMLCFHTTTHYCVFIPSHTSEFSYHNAITLDRNKTVFCPTVMYSLTSRWPPYRPGGSRGAGHRWRSCVQPSRL